MEERGLLCLSELRATPGPAPIDLPSKSPRLLDVTKWGEEEVGRWLESIGCAPFRSTFRQHQILGEDLLDLDSEDLLEMGVMMTVQRKWIMQQVSTLRRKARGKKAMEELYEKGGMLGPLSPRSESEGTIADNDEEIHGQSDDESDDLEENWIDGGDGGEDRASDRAIEKQSVPKPNAATKGKKEKANHPTGDTPFPGIPLYNEKRSPLVERRNTITGPEHREEAKRVTHRHLNARSLLKWGQFKQRKSESMDAKVVHDRRNAKEGKEDAPRAPTSSSRRSSSAMSPRTVAKAIQQEKEVKQGPLDIAKYVSQMEPAQTNKEKKKRGSRIKAKSVTQSDSASSSSDDSHSSRKRSDSKTSFNASDVSISEFEPFEAPSDLAKRPKGVHLPLPTFEKDELDMGDMIAVTASGSVHSARWRGTRVAIKQMRMVELNRARVMNDFRNEVEILGKLRHPTIVSMMAYCCDPPDLFLMMEYMEGGSLHEFLHVKETKLSRLEKVNIALRIAQGMNFIHLSKIIHRDLKPQNILMDEHTRPKICDFGLSKTREHTLTHQGIHGTAPYMAPELLDSDEAGRYGGKSDERVDVYSFAIVLWELFTRKKPWEGKALPQLVYPVLSGKRPGPLPQKCPSSIKALIEMCWDGDFLNRPYFHQILPVIEQEYKRQKALKRKSEKRKKEKLVNKSKELAKRVKELEEQNAKVEELMKRLVSSAAAPTTTTSPTTSPPGSAKGRRSKRSGDGDGGKKAGSRT